MTSAAPLISGLSFYDRLPPIASFADLTDPRAFLQVPEDWLVGVADIVDSTVEISKGRYKTVNTVGAAVISAMVNALSPSRFPYVFGGDGAGFAVWPEAAPAASAALAAVQAWALNEFDIRLRAALVPVSDIAAAGHPLRVARYRVSDAVDYAMFSGGGLSWAEAEMKGGRYAVQATPGAVPDLAGLSCRWDNFRSRNGTILSVVVFPGARATEATFAHVARQVVTMGDTLAGSGRPVAEEGPVTRFPPRGLELEARASHGSQPLWRRRLELLGLTLFSWFLFRTGLRLGNFEPRHYRATVAANADFRKFDDALKMTLDCDADTRTRIESLLKAAEADGIVRFGLFDQDEAMMTCFVPSATQDDHVHFIDGAGGGYAQAAAQIKATQRA